MKPRLQYILFHFFLDSCLSFSLIFCFFSFTHRVTHRKPVFSPKGCYGEQGTPERRGGHSYTTAALWVAYSHPGEPPAELCPMLLDANFFTSCFSFSCKRLRKVRTADRLCLTFLYLWNQHILWEIRNLNPPRCFLKHQGQGFVKELDVLKDSYFCFDRQCADSSWKEINNKIKYCAWAELAPWEEDPLLGTCRALVCCRARPKSKPIMQWHHLLGFFCSW